MTGTGISGFCITSMSHFVLKKSLQFLKIFNEGNDSESDLWPESRTGLQPLSAAPRLQWVITEADPAVSHAACSAILQSVLCPLSSDHNTQQRPGGGESWASDYKMITRWEIGAVVTTMSHGPEHRLSGAEITTNIIILESSGVMSDKI